MPEVSFGPNQVPIPPQSNPSPTGPAPSQVPATIPSGAVAPSGLLLGDKIPAFSEVILPRLNITQNIGVLKDSFDPGTLVFNQAVPLFVPGQINPKTGNLERQPTPPVVITVLGFRPTRFCEKVAGGVRGLIVNTEAEVRASGGTLDWAEWNLKKASGMKRFESLADALIAIERPAICLPEGADPAADDPVFVYDVNGKKYAIAFWAMRGTSYTAAAKRVFFPARLTGCLRKAGYPSWNYAVTVREESYDNGNKAWIPVCLPNQASTPEFMAWAQSVLNPESAPAAQPAS